MSFEIELINVVGLAMMVAGWWFLPKEYKLESFLGACIFIFGLKFLMS